jgi:hypothetical protein
MRWRLLFVGLVCLYIAVQISVNLNSDSKLVVYEFSTLKEASVKVRNLKSYDVGV